MQITIIIPDGEKASWSTYQLAKTGCEIDRLTATHLESIKDALRVRLGTDGGRAEWKQGYASVSKLGVAKASPDWKALAQAALAELEPAKAKALLEKHSPVKPPRKQTVTFK